MSALRKEVSASRGPNSPSRSSRTRAATVRFLGYALGIVIHPGQTIDRLARETSVVWGATVAALGVAQVWGNMLLFTAFGFNWLGTLSLTEQPTALGSFTLADPIYVGWFGYWRVAPAEWLPIFAALMPLLAITTLTVGPGTAHLLSKIWGGKGSFEQMVNVLGLAMLPGLLISWLSEWLTGVPMNLLSGHPNWYVAVLQGEYGQMAAMIWTAYSVAVYSTGWLWEIALGVVGIRRVQRIPVGGAIAAMLASFGLNLLLASTFTR